MKSKDITSLKNAKDEHHARHSLFRAINLIQNIEEAEQFFNDLCTPAELQVMIDRWRVVEPIKNGEPYRKIYDDTGISATTIGRVARFISHGTGGYNLIYQRLNKKNAATTKA